MNDVSISELRQNLPAWLKRVQHGERVGVTVRGAVVAELAPPSDRQAEAKRALAKLRKAIREGKVKLGDLITPIDAEWTYDRDNL